MPHADRTARHAALLPTRFCRDATIDVLRGIALFIMVAANMTALLETPHPLAYRFYSTLAAPIFILVAGMLAARSHILQLHDRGLLYHLERGAFIVAIGALLDIAAWRNVPFFSPDLLYFVGAMLPLVYLAAKAPYWLSSFAALAIFAATPLMQQRFGYLPEPAHYPLHMLETGNRALQDIIPVAAARWLVDGWFPLFPWAGYMLLGPMLARARWLGGGMQRFTSLRFFALGAGLVTLGGLLFAAAPGNLYDRAGGVLNHPPHLVMLTLTMGLTLLLFFVIDRSRNLTVWQLLRCLGEAPLLMYILHVLIIARVLAPVFGPMKMEAFLTLYACLMLWLLCMGWVIRLLKQTTLPTPKPRPGRWLLGLEA